MEDKQIIQNSYMSESINEISAALSAFQGSVEQPKLEKEVKVNKKAGGFYTFKYADLSVCVKAAAPALKSNGLSVCQLISDGKLVTILSHKSGQWFKSELMLPNQTTDYQAYGSAITYLKRYSYCAILGLVADTDDDANMACGNQTTFVGGKKSTNKADAMKQAVAEANAAKTDQELQDVWEEWGATYPSVTQNGTEFYNVVARKFQAFNAAK